MDLRTTKVTRKGFLALLGMLIITLFASISQFLTACTKANPTDAKLSKLDKLKPLATGGNLLKLPTDSNPQIIVDLNACNACSGQAPECYYRCPMNCFEIGSNGKPKKSAYAEQCTACEACIEVCPASAIHTA